MYLTVGCFVWHCRISVKNRDMIQTLQCKITNSTLELSANMVRSCCEDVHWHFVISNCFLCRGFPHLLQQQTIWPYWAKAKGRWPGFGSSDNEISDWANEKVNAWFFSFYPCLFGKTVVPFFCKPPNTRLTPVNTSLTYIHTLNPKQQPFHPQQQPTQTLTDQHWIVSIPLMKWYKTLTDTVWEESLCITGALFL